MKRKKKKIGAVQGHALLYGRSSRAIRIVYGEIVGGTEKKKHSPKRNVGTVKSVQQMPKKQKQPKVPKKYVMSETVQKKLDNLGDPLAKISRYERAQKYEAASSGEKYEYGLSDW